MSGLATLSTTTKPRQWLFPPRFMLFLAILVLGTAGLSLLVSRWDQAVLIGFDLAAAAFILSLWPLTRDHTSAEMRAHARANDARRVTMLFITSLVMVVIITAVTVELPDAKHESGNRHVIALVLVLVSLVIAWLFANIIFALHYTHLYYRDHSEGGLNFPRDEQPTADDEAPRHGVIVASRSDDGDEDGSSPDYLDFAYFSLTIGMAFATADVSMPGRKFRRTAIVHAILAFFYNLIVIAFTINVTAGS